MAAVDLQYCGARILRDLVAEVRQHLYLAEEWFDEALAEADPASEEDLNVILFANWNKLQDLLAISGTELRALVENYDLLVAEIRKAVSAQTDADDEEDSAG